MVSTNLICFPKCFFGRIFVIAHRSAQKSGGRSEEVFFFNDKKNLRLEKNKNFLQKGEKRDRAGRGGGSGVEGGTKVKVVKNSELGCGGKVEGKRTKSIYVCGNWGHKI